MPQGVELLRSMASIPKPITGKGIQYISIVLDPLGFDSTTHPMASTNEKEYQPGADYVINTDDEELLRWFSILLN